MHLATLPDKHCRRPIPTKATQIPIVGLFINSCSGIRFALLSFPRSFGDRQSINGIVDVLVWLPCYYSYGTDHTVTSTTFIACFLPTTIVLYIIYHSPIF